jgi:hypothetical protein
MDTPAPALAGVLSELRESIAEIHDAAKLPKAAKLEIGKAEEALT